MDLELKDKVAVITGGVRGIGGGIAEMLLEEGCCVTIVDRDRPEPGCQDSVAERRLAVQGDLTDTDVCRDAVEQTLSRFGRIDILINNAGVNDGAGLAAGVDAFTRSLQKNLIHYYAMAHFALAALKESQGCIINIGSKVCVTGQGGTSGYAAAKGAVNGLTREWAVDLSPFGIRVNAVLPAEAWTPLYERCLAAMPDPDSAKESIERLIPLGHRFTAIRELAAMVTFLASPISSHTTGQIIHVDGGYAHLDRKCTAADVAAFGAAR